MTQSKPSAIDLLKDLRGQYPDTPFLALGQTVWWDEPMKAALRSLLDSSGIGGTIILGVHDTDYFARARVRRSGQAHIELMPHNDGETKDLWSAAGEISRLFGSETFPTRNDFIKHGVPFDYLAKTESEPEFVNRVTEAWGWRGLVYTGSRDLIVHDLKLSDMGDSLEQMLRYGFEGTIESLVDDCCSKEARALAERMLTWVREYRQQNPDSTLSDLYQHLFPRLFCLLLGNPPADTAVTCTADLLRFNLETAGLPRFQFVDFFLNEKTAKLAAQAYNDAVARAEIYTLDKFGLGALPFDLVVPGHGRGTLRVTLRAIHVEFRQPARIKLAKPITSVHELAEALHAEFGPEVVLVGKAVALISMLAREFIFVFNEEGSQYVKYTRRMNDQLRASGVDVQAHPILRLCLNTWDALEVGLSSIQLPDHLKHAFGREEIATAELATRWQNIVATQDQLLADLKAMDSPRDLMASLEAHDAAGGWEDRVSEYNEAKERLRLGWHEAADIQADILFRYAWLRRIKQEIVDTEHQKSRHFHTTKEWTPEEEQRREGFSAKIESLLRNRESVLSEIAHLKEERLALERSPQREDLRNQVTEIERAAALVRLRLVRNALLTTTGLRHTDHRPTAWWLPMVDPCGHWFRRIVETTELYTEPLLTL